MGGGGFLPPRQNTFLCQTSPFQAREATSAWGQYAGSPCRTAFNGAFMQGVLKCAVAVGLITQGIWFGISTCGLVGASGKIQGDLFVSVVTGQQTSLKQNNILERKKYS